MMNATKEENQLMRICKDRGVECLQVNKGNGHWQIKGPLLINYYPRSKNKTAYVAGTTEGVKHQTPKQAVAMAFKAPTQIKKKAPRKGNYKSLRRKLHESGINNCHWCGMELTLETSTMEHIIPLHRGGLDHSNNRTLACSKCNSERGSDMPELKENLK